MLDEDEVATPTGPVYYPDNALLTLAQVAAGIQIGLRSAERLRLPVIPLGPQTRRYLWGDVITFLRTLSQ